MECGVVVSIANLISLLHNIKFFNANFKSNVRMYGATSKKIITPRAIGYTRVCALIRQRFIDVKCYYLPHFRATLLSHISVLRYALAST